VASFVVYRIATLAHGCAPIEIPLDSRFELDPAALDRALDEARPNLIFFALPNNPTGTLWPRSEIVRVLSERPDIIVVADEAYVEYSGESYLDLLAAHPNLVVMRTLSKIGLAALRVGYLVADPALAHEVEKIRPPYNIGALNQAAATFLLGRHRDVLRAPVARVVAERTRLERELARRGLEVFPSRANFLLVRAPEATRLWHRLVEKGVLVRSF